MMSQRRSLYIIYMDRIHGSPDGQDHEVDLHRQRQNNPMVMMHVER